MKMRGIVVTDNGVYHPKALVPRLVLYAICLAAIAGTALAGRMPLQTAGLYFALLALPAGWAFYNWRKYGNLGRPSILLANGELVMDRPQSTEVRFALDRLQEVHVHGMRGKRTYRFTGSDGAVEEVSPLWARQVEAAVIQFLQHRLPPSVKVTVDEPTTLFAAFRGGKS
jgi:hypothetical protein